MMRMIQSDQLAQDQLVQSRAVCMRTTAGRWPGRPQQALRSLEALNSRPYQSDQGEPCLD